MNIAGVNLTPLLGSIAAKLAHLDADQQAAFLNTFFKELTHACETRFNAEMQLAVVRVSLTSDSRNLAAMLTEIP